MNGLLEGNGRTNQSWVPALDVWETENEIVYAVDLPGISEEKISVELDDGALTITAERDRTEEESDERFYRYERHYGTFSRTVGVPQGVTAVAALGGGAARLQRPPPTEPVQAPEGQGFKRVAVAVEAATRPPSAPAWTTPLA